MKKHIILAAVLIASLSMSAQQIPLFSQYYMVPMLHNPALTGINDRLDLNLIHKSMWKDIPGAPVTSALSLQGPIAVKNIALGGVIFNDVTDIVQRIGFSTNYSYNIKINDDMRVLAGLGIGVMDQKIDFSRVIVKNPDDPMLFRSAQHKVTLNADFGTAFRWKEKLEVGIAIPQLIAQKLTYKSAQDTSIFQMVRHYFFTTKYVFDVNKDKGMTAYPYIMLRYVPNTPLQYDINGIFDWNKIGWVGVSYRSNYAVGLNLGLRYNALSVGYAYDYVIGPLSTYAGGAHEILLGYTFGKKDNEEADKVKKQREEELSKSLSMTDSILSVVKKNSDKQKITIDSLKQQLSDVQAKVNSVPQTTTTSGGGETEETGDWRKAKMGDFNTVPEGGTMSGGYYVVVGAFKSKESAEQQKDKFVKMGYTQSKMIFNAKRGLYYVYSQSTPVREAADKELKDVRTVTTDAWIYDMQQ